MKCCTAYRCFHLQTYFLQVSITMCNRGKVTILGSILTHTRAMRSSNTRQHSVLACCYASALISVENIYIQKQQLHLFLVTARRHSCYTDPHSSIPPPARGLEAFGNVWTLPRWPQDSPSEGQMSRLVERGKRNTAGRDTGSHCCKMLQHTSIQFFFCWNHLLRKTKQ